MLASLLTLLLGKVAEAWLMHAKARNLMLTFQKIGGTIFLYVPCWLLGSC